jgi:formamidopyrimidine-DNA glycosylase
MPEMPEVHALSVELSQRLEGHVLERLDIVAFSALKTVDPPVSAVAGRTVQQVTRHGKYLDFDLGDLHVVLHLARAGWVRWYDELPPPRPGRGALAARLVVAGGSGLAITEAGSKKSLAIWVVRDPVEVPGIATLGPEPLAHAFTQEKFAEILRRAGRAQIKGVLRSQGLIAGIGNAYSDEILHVARMSPFKPAAMSDEEVGRLYAALRSTLEDAVRRAEGVGAVDLKGEKRSGMRVHGRVGQACPVCGDKVRQVRFADSTLEYCATCQTGGKPLADRALSRLGIPMS